MEMDDEFKTYVVSEKEYERLQRLLDNPPPPNEKLKAAVRRYFAMVDQAKCRPTQSGDQN